MNRKVVCQNTGSWREREKEGVREGRGDRERDTERGESVMGSPPLLNLDDWEMGRSCDSCRDVGTGN